MIAITVPARTNSPSCSFFHSDILPPPPSKGLLSAGRHNNQDIFDRRHRTVEQYFQPLWTRRMGQWSEFKHCLSLGLLFFQFRVVLRLVTRLTRVLMLVVIAFLFHSALVAHGRFALPYLSVIRIGVRHIPRAFPARTEAKITNT